MKLFIAFLIIYGLHLSPWLYPVAIVIWVMGLPFIAEGLAKALMDEWEIGP